MFLRFLVVPKSADLSIEDILSYELCPHFLDLFKAKNTLCKEDKPQVIQSTRDLAVNVLSEAVPNCIPE
ncbi:hypothetical protein DPMN_180454 [Dreissena polymorpha]|uniref:Uncharacterized protein n=1 Tax=Dreissena polymorpha TaxID=45954 RepID=A0A9D4EG84_DREPO|nr:hypothetical protein DPMN_180454 [Dreissena polymorpha]